MSINERAYRRGFALRQPESSLFSDYPYLNIKTNIELAHPRGRHHIVHMPIDRLDRTVFSLSGEGVEDWLSGLITNDIADDITFAALLTPQGKIIADFFVYKWLDGLLLDTPTKFAADLHKRLRLSLIHI